MLTESGSAVMRGERAARLLLPEGRSGASPDGGAATGGGRDFVVRRRPAREAGGAEADVLDDEARRRFEALRAHRLELARLEGVPPYVVASDRSLRELATLRPTRENDLTLAHGIGDAKVRKYGAGFLRGHVLDDSR